MDTAYDFLLTSEHFFFQQGLRHHFFLCSVVFHPIRYPLVDQLL